MSENLDWKDYLKQLMKRIKWLNWRGRRSVSSRGKEIKEILEGLSQYEIGITEDRDIAREEFRGAVQRYLCGFYEDSIYHSCFSVEMGLLIKLNEFLTADEKEILHERINQRRNPMSFTFGTIKSKCEANHILSGSANELANGILGRRNSHIHAHNFVSAAICIRRKSQEDYFRLGEMIRSIEEQGSLQRRFIIKILNQLLTPEHIQRFETLGNLSDFKWCSKDRIRESVEEDVEAYVRNTSPIIQEFLEDSSKLRLRKAISSIKKLYEYSRPDAYMKKRAYGILKDSYNVLKSIQIF